MKPKRKITELSIEEVSLVSAPACEQARIAIMKKRDTPEMRALLNAFVSTERARRLTAIETGEALWRGSPALFKAAGVDGPAELAFAVVRLRRRGEL